MSREQNTFLMRIRESSIPAARLKTAVIILLCGLMTGCGLFDSGVVWKEGNYELVWIDVPNDVTLSYVLDKDSAVGRVEARVYSVGWDGRYVVAKQHPKGDKTITNYFIIDAQKDSKYADPAQTVIGPLTEAEYQQKSAALKLPRFSKTLESLQ